MEDAYLKSKTLSFKKEEWLTEEWAKIKDADKYGDFLNDTGVATETLKRIGEQITKLPPDSKFHP